MYRSLYLSNSNVFVKFIIFYFVFWCLSPTHLLQAAEEYEKNVKSREFSEKKISLIDSVQSAITRHPFVHLQDKQVELKTGALQSASGQFDMTLGASISHNRDVTPLTDLQKSSYGTSDIKTDTTTYTLNAVKQFRSGISITPEITMTRSDDSLSNSLSPTTNKAAISFLINVPLLRNRGKEATGAAELSSEYNLESSEFSLRHTVSQTIRGVVQSYWAAIAAEKNLKIRKSAELRAIDMLKKIEILVEADELPASEIDQLSANLASKTSSRLNAEQQYLESRQNLALAMGLPIEEIPFPPAPYDDFPELNDNSLPDNSKTPLFIKHALQHRQDINALKKEQKAAETLLNAAIINKKSKLDFSLSVGYAGLDEDTGAEKFFTPYYNNVRGLNVAGAITYEIPVKNNSRRGILAQRRAAHDQANIKTNDLARNISSEVIVATSDLIQTAAELKKARESVQLFDSAVEKENMKLRLGVSTVIDLINMDNNLTNALLNEISATRGYANALIQFRYVTGTIISEAYDESSVGIKQIITIPLL